ncbi:MAG: hypothetical protein LBT01_06935 [Spirochaetaceae bacterium]|jgi:hypothetical protein|nr:hypothetical protein [Spirochaetaceae bacterium]
MNESKKRTVLELVFFIVDWSKIKVISSIFDQVHVRFHFVAKGQGTASSEILDMLGVGSAEKAVILCLEQDMFVPALLKEVGKKLGLHMPGTGIGFSVPLSGINAPILNVFKESIEKSAVSLGTSLANEGEKKMNSNNPQCDLIIAILNQGYSDEFMAAARGAGAGGGTVINARGLMHKGPVKFFGISVQDEKEIVLILSTREKMKPIMETVSKSFGISSKAEGIVFSLPADNITGIDLRS